MPVTLRRAALAAAFAFLSPGAARADTPLAASGPYTLTQSLVDADAAYLGWAAGRTLTPGERQRLGVLDLARFRRDPAWTVKALGGEQKNLPLFQTMPAQTQDGLRRTVVNDLPSFPANHLTPDEARQMQQIVAGTDAVASGAPRPASPATPRAAAPARPAAAAPENAARLPLHSGPHTLTRGMVDTDLAVAQWAARRPLAAAERRQVTAIDVAQFRRDPAWTVQALRREVTDLKALARMDPVRLAAWRKAGLVSDAFHTADHLTPAEGAAMLGIYTRANPVLGTDAATRAVVTQRDVDAWVAATRFLTAQAHVPGPGPDYRAGLARLARDPAHLGAGVEDDVANMERNWAALHLIWPHLSASQRARAVAARLAGIRRAAALGQNFTAASVQALDLCQKEYGDYPYALDPRLEAYKLRAQMRTGLFNQRMMEYNTQTMMRGQEDYQRGLRGEGPNPQPIPVPVP